MANFPHSPGSSLLLSEGCKISRTGKKMEFSVNLYSLFGERLLSLISRFVTVLLITLACGTPHGGASAQSPDTVKVIANQDVVDVVAKWDPTLQCYTSTVHPISTLDNLQQPDIAFWAADHMYEGHDFLVAAKAQGGVWPRIIGVGNKVFTDDFVKRFPDQKPPKLFCTSNSWEGRRDDDGKLLLEGAVRVIFVTGSPVQHPATGASKGPVGQKPKPK